eukprot:SM000005S17339  [mRNA]  locus=s5:1405445:1410362:- [translate_table: standard]
MRELAHLHSAAAPSNRYHGCRRRLLLNPRAEATPAPTTAQPPAAATSKAAAIAAASLEVANKGMASVASPPGGAKLGSPLPIHLPKRAEKPRIVVLGSGWAACRVLRGLRPDRFDLVAVSPRNHMVFTPLLASTAVGTLEPRSVAIPVRNIQPALNSITEDNFYFFAACTSIDPANHLIYCMSASPEDSRCFTVEYDKLVIAVGSAPNTFGIKGVHENAIFLREIEEARAVRKTLILNLMKANIPGTPEDEKRQLLSCIVVGGGPTGVEFSGELSDFIRRDVHSKFPNLEKYLHVTLIEMLAPAAATLIADAGLRLMLQGAEILSSFDEKLRAYAIRALEMEGVTLRKGFVTEVLPKHLSLSDGTSVPYGLLVWSTGVGPTAFVKSLPFEKSRGGRIATDEWLRIKDVEDIYAIGQMVLAFWSMLDRLLQSCLRSKVAERQGRYLSQQLNQLAAKQAARAGCRTDEDCLDLPKFKYKQVGSMTTVGGGNALIDLRESKGKGGLSFRGFFTFLVWRSAYLTQVVTWRSRFYVLTNWLTTFLFGRDTSRF